MSQSSGFGGGPGFMSSDYWQDNENLSWAEGASQRYNSEHSIDPRTGGITGPLGPIPAQVGLHWQAAHDQAVWNARNRMAQEAQRYALGATGLMTSYRAGGGAAIQANAYGNLANVQLQRAQMMQPLDLLGDYRRHQLAQAGRAGKDESLAGAGIQLAGAALSVAFPGVGTAIGAALMVGGGMLAGEGARKQNASFVRAGGGGSMVGGQGSQTQAFAQLAQAGNQIRQAGVDQPGVPGQGGAPIPGFRDTELGISPGTPGGAAAPVTAGTPGGTAQAQMEPDAANKSMGPQGAAGSPQMAIPPVVGADGNFSPMSYAAHAAAASPIPFEMQAALSGSLAMQLASDPSWSIISMKIDRELMLRTLEAA